MGDPSIAGPSFKNATGAGAARRKKLAYAGLSRISPNQSRLAFLNADNPDLAAFQAQGGCEATKSFHRYYTIPAFGHCMGIGQKDGLTGEAQGGPAASPAYILL